MAAFAELDWQRFDVHALISGRGLATLDEVDVARCTAWLQRNGYRIVTLDFSQGIGDAVVRLGELLEWRDQFGYDLTRESRGLDALRDGFDFGPKDDEGVVLMLRAFDRAWSEDVRWSSGLLEIAAEQSLWQLACGRRFFAIIVASDLASLAGQPLETPVVPFPFHGKFR